MKQNILFLFICICFFPSLTTITKSQEIKTVIHNTPEHIVPVLNIKTGDTVIINGFSEAGTTLSNIMTEQLNQYVRFLKEYPELKIRIEGHSDNRGTHNQITERATNRAQAVQQYLINQGIPQERIKYEGRGALSPHVPNTTAENRAKNRRVSIVIPSN